MANVITRKAVDGRCRGMERAGWEWRRLSGNGEGWVGTERAGWEWRGLNGNGDG